jgi:signal transduction histidine kinase
MKHPNPGGPLTFQAIGFLFCLVLYRSELHAQTDADSLVFNHLTEQDGLSDNKVNCFLQDRNGFVWIGTANGLNRFDGSFFHVYKAGEGGLGDNEILGLGEGRNGEIWIATRSGLSEYDADKDRFHTFRLDEPDVNSNLLTSVLADSTGLLWAGTYKGLWRFDTRTRKLTRYLNDSFPLGPNYGRTNRIHKIHIDRAGRFWLCTGNGVWRFYPATGRFEQYIGVSQIPSGEPFVKTIFEDREARLWLGSYGDGPLLFDPFSRTVKDVFPKEPRLRNASSITGIQDSEGHEWLNAGIMQADPRSQTSRPLLRVPPGGDEFEVRATYVSKDNLLWWGTDKGIWVADPARRFFRHVNISADPITSQGVSLLASDHGFYAGGKGEHFLQWFDCSVKQRKVILHDLSLPALLNIVREDDHHLWLCTESGLYLFDERTGSYRSFHTRKGDSSMPAMDFMNNLFIDSKGNHWLFPWRSGIWQIDGRTGKFTRMFLGFSTEDNELKKLLIASAVEDRLGRIWFADLDEGLVLFDPATRIFSKPAEKIFGPKWQLDNLVLQRDLLWAVLPGKVFSFHTITGEARQWNIPDEYNADIHGFCQDSAGHLWIATGKGLLSFDLATHLFNRFTEQDGLKENDMREDLRTLPDGDVVYTAPRYFTLFNPARLVEYNKAFPVLLTAVYSQNKPLSVQQKEGRKFLDLDHSFSSFTFNWAVQNYHNPQQNRYYYKLEGVDTGWKYAGNKGVIQFAGLQPGRYLFRMNGAGSSGVMNEQGDSIEILIRPPFWKQAWFLALSSLSLLTLFVLIVRYVSQRNLRERILVLEKEQAVERERNRISRDMHDGLGSGLTKIAIMSEVVKQQLDDPGKARLQLENIAESSRELVDNLQDIIWVLNPQNDTLESLAAYIRAYGLDYFEPFGIDVRFDYPDKFPAAKLPETTRRNIFLTVKESFNNISKHAWCNQVRVVIRCGDQTAELSIADDGKGFDPEKLRPFANGLLNMQHRIEQVGGRYEILSAPGKGTRTLVAVPFVTVPL